MIEDYGIVHIRKFFFTQHSFSSISTCDLMYICIIVINENILCCLFKYDKYDNLHTDNFRYQTMKLKILIDGCFDLKLLK